MNLDIEAKHIETGSSLVNKPRFAYNLLYSGATHAFAAYILVATGVHVINLDRKSTRHSAPQPISVSLYGKDILDDATPSREIATGQPLIYFVDAVPPVESKPSRVGEDLEGKIRMIGEGIHRIEESMDHISEDMRAIREDIHAMNNDMHLISNDMRAISVSLDKIADELTRGFRDIRLLLSETKRYNEIYGGMKVILSQNGNLSQYYSDCFKPEERNEKSYIDFFRAYASAYLDINSRSESVLSILKRNSSLPKIIDVTIELGQDGLFKILNLDALPGFNDDNGSALRHYQELFDKMPKTFVTPEMAGLKTPYQFKYAVLNPATSN